MYSPELQYIPKHINPRRLIMEIIGTIKDVFQPQSGTSQRGNQYTTQTILITYGDRYPKDLALTLMNNSVETYGAYLRPGLQLKFYFEASSREYNGRFYTECTVWKIESLQAQPQAQTYHAASMPVPAPTAAPAPMPTVTPQPQYPQYAPQQMPNYGPQYGAPTQQPQNPQPPSGQGYGPTADNLPFPRQ